MDMLSQLEAKLKKIAETNEKLEHLSVKMDGHMAFWKMAVLENNGEEENKQRQALLAILNERLDHVAFLIQLSKRD